MKKIIGFLLLMFLVTCIAAAQTVTHYRSTYDRSGRLIGLFNLTEKTDCGFMTFLGTIRTIRFAANSDEVQFLVVTKPYNRDVVLDLSKLANADRGNFYHYILKRGRGVEVGGYACGSLGNVDPMYIRRR